MTEKWALLLVLAGGMAAFVVTAVGIKLLGGGEEPMALAGFLFLCVTAWESSGVVMRYADKRRSDARHRR